MLLNVDYLVLKPCFSSAFGIEDASDGHLIIIWHLFRLFDSNLSRLVLGAFYANCQCRRFLEFFSNVV